MKLHNNMANYDKNKEVDINEVAITLEVDRNLIDEVRSGKVTHLVMDINENNQNLILENIEGNQVLVTEEMPTKYHGCYFYIIDGIISIKFVIVIGIAILTSVPTSNFG